MDGKGDRGERETEIKERGEELDLWIKRQCSGQAWWHMSYILQRWSL